MDGGKNRIVVTELPYLVNKAKLIEKIQEKQAPVVVGLDPMLSYVPQTIREKVLKEQGETLAFLNDEMSRELDVTITETDGRTLRLLFPEFVEVYEENCSSHFFDYNIQGGGYPYHHCFHQKKLSLKTYDSLWKAFRGIQTESSCALRLAWWRLRYPVELAPWAEEGYLNHLRAYAGAAVRWLLEEKDPGGLRFLLERVEPDKETLTEACAIAREQGAAEALAILLEEQHKRFPSGLNKTFDL